MLLKYTILTSLHPNAAPIGFGADVEGAALSLDKPEESETQVKEANETSSEGAGTEKNVILTEEDYKKLSVSDLKLLLDKKEVEYDQSIKAKQPLIDLLVDE